MAWSKCDISVLGTVSRMSADDGRIPSVFSERKQRFKESGRTYLCHTGGNDRICIFPGGKYGAGSRLDPENVYIYRKYRRFHTAGTFGADACSSDRICGGNLCVHAGHGNYQKIRNTAKDTLAGFIDTAAYMYAEPCLWYV